ncbi:OLC1v1038375C1 [Oldenlandia corymbosa var. corymbosa]|uniref:OLC1v1038375C1 n=1 Tax=Oldenlandia corymbosa var. corymbosa TaxID=529605 RepID=A0AAV1D142_OLDCO|nr:OLC1v1038375C1 [Oldenlandia corymbosa var. corymbosa]
MEAITFLQYFKPSATSSFLQQFPASSLSNKKLLNFSSISSSIAEVDVAFFSHSNYNGDRPDGYGDSGKQELNSLGVVKAGHAQIIKMSKEWTSDDKIQSLIVSYLEFGDFYSASGLFLLDYAQNYLCWNSFLDEFSAFGGDPFEILKVFGDLSNKGVKFDSKILTLLLKICGNLMDDSWLGCAVHACVIKRGLDLDVHVKCAMMNFYGKCWGTEIANQAFFETSNPDSLLWNEAVLVNLRNEEWAQGLKLFGEMQHSFLSCTTKSKKVNTFVVAKVLHACAKLGAIHEGKQIHGYVIRNLLQSSSNAFISNSLINMYMKCNEPEFARLVFDSMNEHDLSSWNSIISGYSALGNLNEAMRLFRDMQEDSEIRPDIVTWNCILSGHFASGFHQEVLRILEKMQIARFRPNTGTITVALQAVSELGLLRFGKEIHCFLLRNGLEHDLHVGTSLLDMYVKNDKLINARTIFNNMINRNIFAWNCMISGYVSRGFLDEALDLLVHMKKEGLQPDLVTYNTLVSGYANSGFVQEALATIHQIELSGFTPNVVSWTALISGCTQSGYFEDALKYSIEMQKAGLKPNSATLASLLRASSGLALLQKGKELHNICIRNGFSEDFFVATALIDMYCKCGSLKSGYDVFRKIEINKRSVSCWNSMIGGLAMYSRRREAILLFHQMLEANIKPDSRTFTALLSGCKNSSLIDEGWKYFDSMKIHYDITPTIEHYSCMVDLLGKAGYLDEAWDLIHKMPMKPDASVWGAFLASCRSHKDLELGKIAAEKLFKLEPYNAANYVLLMNLYSDVNRWSDVQRIKDLMEVKGIKVGPVWSWIRVNKMVHVFYAVGKPHPDEGEILFELYQLMSEMKMSLGYVPATECVIQNIDEEEKKKILLRHTEKLAITYGLIHSKNNATPVRVIKNSRTCADCHTVAKFMSKLRGRDIILRDGKGFHHFSNGQCSCNDFG